MMTFDELMQQLKTPIENTKASNSVLTPLDDEDIFDSIEEMEQFADSLLLKYST